MESMRLNNTPEATLSAIEFHKSLDANKAAQSFTDRQADDAKTLQDIEEKAQEFEAVFVAQMLKPMFAGLDYDGPFGGGKGEEVFRGMMLQEYGDLIAQTGSLGIADHIKEAMIRMQEEASGHSLTASQDNNVVALNNHGPDGGAHAE